jgi:hypothetical protein
MTATLQKRMEPFNSQQIYNHIMGLNLKHTDEKSNTHSIYIYYSSGQPRFSIISTLTTTSAHQESFRMFIMS